MSIIARIVAQGAREAGSHDALGAGAAFRVVLAADAHSGYALRSGAFRRVFTAKFGLAGLGEKRAVFLFSTIAVRAAGGFTDARAPIAVLALRAIGIKATHAGA